MKIVNRKVSKRYQEMITQGQKEKPTEDDLT